jgi:ribosome-binding factor A
MKPFSRAERVGGQIQKVLSDVLARRIRDPRLEMATISSVKMTSDLRIARIYFATSSQTITPQDATEGFTSAIGYLKRRLARELGLRYMPELQFYYDDTFDYGSQISSLLHDIQTENEADHTAPE